MVVVMDKKVLDHVDSSKRAFVRKVVLGTAFVVPAVVSFDMDSMTVQLGANAYARASNTPE